MSFQQGCNSCLRRPREDGGLGDCPMFRGRLLWSDRKGAEVRETLVEGWEHHSTDLFPNGCSNFKVGDRRTKQRNEPMEGLF